MLRKGRGEFVIYVPQRADEGPHARRVDELIRPAPQPREAKTQPPHAACVKEEQRPRGAQALCGAGAQVVGCECAILEGNTAAAGVCGVKRAVRGHVNKLYAALEQKCLHRGAALQRWSGGNAARAHLGVGRFLHIDELQIKVGRDEARCCHPCACDCPTAGQPARERKLLGPERLRALLFTHHIHCVRFHHLPRNPWFVGSNQKGVDQPRVAQAANLGPERRFEALGQHLVPQFFAQRREEGCRTRRLFGVKRRLTGEEAEAAEFLLEKFEWVGARQFHLARGRPVKTNCGVGGVKREGEAIFVDAAHHAQFEIGRGWRVERQCVDLHALTYGCGARRSRRLLYARGKSRAANLPPGVVEVHCQPLVACQIRAQQEDGGLRGPIGVDEDGALPEIQPLLETGRGEENVHELRRGRVDEGDGHSGGIRRAGSRHQSHSQRLPHGGAALDAAGKVHVAVERDGHRFTLR